MNPINNKRYQKSIYIFLLLAITICCCSCGFDTRVVNITKEDTKAPGIEFPESFTPYTLLDDDCFFISVTNIDYSNLWGYIIELFIENKTDMDLTLTLEEFAINKDTYETRFSHYISGGMTKSVSIELDNQELEDYGISAIDSISFIFNAIPDTEADMEKEEYAKIQKSLNDSFRVFPLGKNTTVDSTEEFDFTISSIDTSDFGLDMSFVIENLKEDGLLIYEINSFYINNTIIKDFEPAVYRVGAGVRSPKQFSLNKEDYNLTNISNIRTVKFRLLIKDVRNSSATIWDKYYTYNI